MKLLKLSPEQLMQYWAYVKECILLSLPPFVDGDSDAILRIQQQLLVGVLECWACVNQETGEFFGILTTQLIADEITATKNLFIFSVTLSEEHEEKVWTEGYQEMIKYAQSKGCSLIIAYSNQEKVISLAQNLGADVSWRLLSFPVFKI